MNTQRILLALLAAAGLSLSHSGMAQDESPEITVYKDPNCGCCSAWIEYLEDNGFKVKAIDDRNVNALKQKLGIASELSSCHTALMDGKIIEGHVPVGSIRRLLAEHPDIKGISVPGMPMMSPGMAPPDMKPRKELGFKVIAFDEDGGTSVYDSY